MFSRLQDKMCSGNNQLNAYVRRGATLSCGDNVVNKGYL